MLIYANECKRELYTNNQKLSELSPANETNLNYLSKCNLPRSAPLDGFPSIGK